MNTLPPDLDTGTTAPTPEEKAAAAHRERMARLTAEAAKKNELNARRRRFQDLGLEGFLAEVEAARAEGLAKAQAATVWTANSARRVNENADELSQWARAHHHEVQAEVARVAATRAAEQARAEQLGQILEAWENDVGESERDPRDVCNEHGIPVARVNSLKEFAEDVRGYVRSDEADALTKALLWHAGREGSAPVQRPPAFIDEPRHWVLATDRSTAGMVPPGLRGAALTAWATEWRDKISGLKGAELCVYAEPGKRVAFVTWWEEPKNSTQARTWCRLISPPPGEDDEPRFAPLPERCYRSWYAPCDALYLPSAYAAPAALPKAASRALPPERTAKLLTGIAPIDGLSDGAPGIARDRIVLFAGPKGSGKSSTAYEIAETALAAGWVVLWVAHDEPAAMIDERRLLRRGLPTDTDRAVLDGEPFHVISRGDELETSWQAAHATADGRPLLVVVDSIQRVVSVATAGLRAQRDRIDTALEAVQSCREKWPALVLMTSEATRDGEAKGSTGIGHAVDVELHIRRSGESALTVRVDKYRGGADGGTFGLRLDRRAQRVLDPTAAAKAKTSAELRARILDAVATLGAKATGQRIEQAIDGVDNKAVRAELAAMVRDGALLHVGKVYRVAV